MAPFTQHYATTAGAVPADCDEMAIAQRRGSPSSPFVMVGDDQPERHDATACPTVVIGGVMQHSLHAESSQPGHLAARSLVRTQLARVAELS